jgi:hypothetical protein
MFALAAGLAALAWATEASAQPKAVKFTNQWKGSVGDEALKKDAPEVITSQKSLEKLWKAWMIEGKVPEVDFTKEIVVIGITSGSKLNLGASLDDKGNLNVGGLATADIAPGFGYVLATVSRDGVKTVNKKELPAN